MKKDKDDIVVDLSGADENLKNLSREDQEQVKRLSEQIKKELSEEEKQRKVSSRMLKKREEKAAASATPVDERPDEYTGNYSEFLKQYSKVESGSDYGKFGKYDSDLDFKLNRKMRKVHLPMPKKRKILISSLMGVAAVLIIAVLAVVLYKPPASITITSMALTQPSSDGIYVVEGNYTGDKMSLDYIYIVCNYSDGTAKKVPITESMITKTRGIDANGRFTDTDAFVNIKYNGQEMTIKYLVEDKIPVELIPIKVSKIISTKRGVNHYIPLRNKLFVNIKYSNGEIKKVALEDCLYDIEYKSNRQCIDGEINVGDLSTATYVLTIKYTETINNQSYTLSNTIDVSIVNP